jgi:hypothetical protein
MLIRAAAAATAATITASLATALQVLPVRQLASSVAAINVHLILAAAAAAICCWPAAAVALPATGLQGTWRNTHASNTSAT